MPKHTTHDALQIETILDADTGKYNNYLDFNRAVVISNSATHGIILCPDRDKRGNLRVVLVGRSPSSSFVPRIKAHNSLTREQALRLAKELEQLAQQLPS